jgi:hypothetical protein
MGCLRLKRRNHELGPSHRRLCSRYRNRAEICRACRCYARSKNSASFIELVLSDINIKTFIGETPLSGIEYGFFRRIAQIAYCGSMN